MLQENMGSYHGPSFYRTPPDWPGYHETREAHETPVATTDAAPLVILNRVSWGAVFAGVVMTLAAQLVFSLLGFGLTAAGIAQAVTHMPAGAFLFLIGLWWALSGIAAASIGGYTAGRMAGAQPAGAAGWHGLVSWAVSVMVVTFILVSGMNTIASDIYQTAAYRGLNGVSYEQDGHINGSALTDGPAIPSAPSAIPNPGISIDQIPVEAEHYSLKVSPPPIAVPATLAALGLLSASALLLGAMGAWFSGRASARKREVRVTA